MTATPCTLCQHKAGTVLHHDAHYTRIMSDDVSERSVWWPTAVKERWLARESLWASKGRPNCSPRGLLTLSRLSRVQGEPALICEENGPPNANWHTAVSTGPTNGAFMLSVLSLMHGCVWQNWHQCTIMSVFNHRLNDGSVKQLRERQIAQRDMLQRFQKYETSLPLSVLMWWCCVSGDTYLSGEYCSCLLRLNGEQK